MAIDNENDGNRMKIHYWTKHLLHTVFSEVKFH